MGDKKESRKFSAERSKQTPLRGAVLRQLTNAALALTACLVLTAGTAWAATFTATVEGSFPVQIIQGTFREIGQFRVKR
jgi:hypothetical protein